MLHEEANVFDKIIILHSYAKSEEQIDPIYGVFAR
ncbi:MAG: hypothetical protein XD86_1074 [Mesotoga infera]|jgi:hypothetical protein|uniref:Uncharacterized protein n=1 Tax=Mesotoga infera TaxID=1236046 RepID=A0A101GY23_9BACT|nr:MAG: hypothetical protein XD86_1074 [Mesotoga infera]